jgi:hypothetical protein
VNPLRSHWLRLTVWLFLLSPAVAFMVALTQGVGFKFALVLTLYMWALVCVILALIALAGLLMRAARWGIRGIRR